MLKSISVSILTIVILLINQSDILGQLSTSDSIQASQNKTLKAICKEVKEVGIEISKIDSSKFRRPVENEITEELKPKILLLEYNLINQKIEQFISTQFTTLYYLLLIIGGFMVFALNPKVDRKKYLYGLPILILILLNMIGYHYQRIMGLQGYKKYLELQINTVAGEDLIFYGHLGMHFMGNLNPFSIANLVIYVSIYILSIFFVNNVVANVGCLLNVVYVGLAILYIFMAMPIISYTSKIYKVSTEINENKVNSKKIDELIKDFDD